MNKDSISRLAVAFFERDPKWAEEYGPKAFEEIEKKLRALKIHIVCSDEIRKSTAQQAALLTMINIGKRCFKGGVHVTMPPNVKSLVRYPGYTTLNELAIYLGGRLNEVSNSITIHIGFSEEKKYWRLLVNNWNAVIVPPNHECIKLLGDDTFFLGGVSGGALIIGSVFLRTTGFDYSIGSDVFGLSLWRPDLHWGDPDSVGPSPGVFPNELWLLGLGHLGQAYSWILGFMPYKFPEEMLIKLQDDDKIVKGNYDSGMLCEEHSLSKHKTRVVSRWLEARKLSTRIIERKYGYDYIRHDDDPPILLVGVDKLEVRKILRTVEFQLVIDCGLGGNLDFDLIRINIFPNNGLLPKELWSTAVEKDSTPHLKSWSEKILGCGYTVGIASAFTGCLSASLAIAEVLRSVNQGIKLSHAYLSIREIQNIQLGIKGFYGGEILARVQPIN